MSMTERDRGFTLIEVVITLTIVSISYVLIMQLFAAGLRSAKSSCDYTRAIVHATSKMNELSDNPVNDSGDFEDGFTWLSEVQVHKELEDNGYKLMNIKVKVMWGDILNRPRSIELVSLKSVADGEGS